jgi:hypothetical protein
MVNRKHVLNIWMKGMLLEPHSRRSVSNMAAGEGATLCTERATLPVDQYQPVRHGLCAYLGGIVLCSVCAFEHCRGSCVVTNFESPNDGRTGCPFPYTWRLSEGGPREFTYSEPECSLSRMVPVKCIHWALSNPRDQSVHVCVCILNRSFP